MACDIFTVQQDPLVLFEFLISHRNNFQFFLFFILFKLYYLIVRVGQYQRKPEKDTYEPEPIKTVERVK